MMWHDGIDPSSVCGLEGAERDQAEKMLIESMQEGSYWAPMGLREMRSEKAVPIMKEMLPSINGVLLIEIAIALNVIEDTLEYNPYILQVLREYPSEYTRLKAAMKLRDFPTHEVIHELFDAMNDESYLVRNHASESLLAIHGLQPMISCHKEIFQLLIIDPKKGISRDEAAAAHKKAEEMLRSLLEKDGKIHHD